MGLCLLVNGVEERLSPEQLQKRYGDALEAIFGIGVRLQALLVDPNVANTNNFIVSPLSVALMVGQLMMGAEGEFREELYNLLSLPISNDHKHSTIHYYGKKNSTFHVPYARLHSQLGNLMRALEEMKFSKTFTLETANALFVNWDIKLKRDFMHNLLIYKTTIQGLNFTTDPVGSQKAINGWAATQTNGVIKSILASPLPPSSSSVFGSAVYFLADWETPFSYEMNIKGPFHSSATNKMEVEYMRGNIESAYYGENKKLGFKLLGLPYKNHDLVMYFLLPFENNGKEYDIKSFQEKLNIKDIRELILQSRRQLVTVQIPKMKLSNSLSILEPLQKYSIYKKYIKDHSLANNTKDALDILVKQMDVFKSFNSSLKTEVLLTAAAEGSALKVSNILQEVILNVNEKGTEAAAVSASIIDYIATKSFRVDRPFTLFIRHEATLATLFWGTIVDPSQS